MSRLLQDLRFGLRVLLRNPAFTALAVVALGLGIGGSTAIFSAVSAALLRPMPYRTADRMVTLWETTPAFNRGSVSGPNFRDWRAESKSFESMAALEQVDANLTGDGAPLRLSGIGVSDDFFRVFGTEPGSGRGFSADEHRGVGPSAVIVSHELWKGRFGADPEMVGKTLTLDGVARYVVGVMPEGFRVPAAWGAPRPQILVPIDERSERQMERRIHHMQVFAVLQPGVSIELAASELDTIAQRLAAEFPEVQAERAVRVIDVREAVVGSSKPALLLLMASVALVLLIACANVAGLMMARGASRQGEFAVRLAVGATPQRIMSQLLTESVGLAVLGGGLGLILALWGIDLIKLGVGERVSQVVDIELDRRVLGFSFVTSVASGVLFGLLPAWHASRANLQAGLKAGAARSTEGRREGRARRLLVVGEISLSITLLVGAGLMVRSLIKLQAIDLGFNPSGVLVVRTSLTSSKYVDDAKVAGFYAEVQKRIGALPGVASVGVTNIAPLSGVNSNGGFQIEGRAPWGPRQSPVVEYRAVSPAYLQTMGIRVTRGRAFSEEDTLGTPRVILINEAMARRYWPDRDPIGARVRADGETEWMEVIGVAGNVINAKGREPAPEVMGSIAQWPASTAALLIRADGNPYAIEEAVKGAIAAVDPEQPIYDVKSMDELVSAWTAEPRFNVLLLSVFAAIALGLAAVGVYGLMSFQVAERVRELGIRLALGAEPRDVMRLILTDGARLVAWGLGLGVAASLGLSRLLSRLLFGVSPHDPTTLVVAVVVLGAVAFVATYLPARRASRVDPMMALRQG